MRGVVFRSPGTVALDELPDPPEDGALIRNDYTLVSQGTELAILSGTESWAPLPFTPGYASVGTVIRSGPGCDYEEGTRVFTHGSHAQYAVPKVLTAPLPDGLDPRHAVFARLATVSITAVRVARVELGDRVVVFGAGLVGNLAAQLCMLSGARVIVVDPNADRLDAAGRAGVHHCLKATGNEIDEIVSLTNGEKCDVAIDATGLPAVIEKGIAAVANGGTFVLLGTPRGRHSADFTAFLRTIHLSPSNVTLVGAHEWRYRVAGGRTPDEKHTIERNTHLVLDLLSEGALRVEHLISHVVSPAEAPKVYHGLKHDPSTYQAVLFDWNALD